MNIAKSLRGCFTAGIVSLSAGGLAYAQEVTLRLHQFLPAQSVVPSKILDVWADNVEQASEGKIKINRFPSMQLGGRPPELIDQAIDGVADIIWTVVGYTPGRFPTTEVFELPFMVENEAAAACAYWTMFERHMEENEFKNVKMLGTWVHGPGVIHASKPIRTPDDLKGMKVRGGSRLVNKLLDYAGATPVGMPVPAVPEALSRGVIDGTTIPWEVTTALKVPELVTNHTEFEGASLYTLTFILAMNKNAYEQLSEELKAVIDAQSGLNFSVFAAVTQERADAPGRKIAEDLGNNIITVTDNAPWKNAVSPIYDEWIAGMEKRNLDGQALIDEARSLMDNDCKGAGNHL